MLESPIQHVQTTNNDKNITKWCKHYKSSHHDMPECLKKVSIRIIRSVSKTDSFQEN